MNGRIVNLVERLGNPGHTVREVIYDCLNHEIHLWRVAPGEWIYPHVHPHSDDIWYIVQGEGDYYSTADASHAVEPGVLAFASPDEVHGIFNSGTEDLIILSVLAPLPLEYAEAPGFVYPDEKT